VHPGLVLIADDDPEFISELSAVLIDRGYLVLGAKDGRAAADLLNKHNFDFALAIIDVFMPLVSGLDLIALLARNQSKVKIIAVSAGRQKVLDTAISLGAHAGMKKTPHDTPLNAREWLDEVFRQIGMA
jgi:CheY-like chemotaxis protein